MTTAELIVRTLELASGSYPTLDEIDSEQSRMADRIHIRYDELQRLLGSNSAAYTKARVEMVEEILARRGETT